MEGANCTEDSLQVGAAAPTVGGRRAAWPGLACRRHRSCPRCIWGFLGAICAWAGPGDAQREPLSRGARERSPRLLAPFPSTCMPPVHSRTTMPGPEVRAATRATSSCREHRFASRPRTCRIAMKCPVRDQVSPAEMACMARFPPRSNGRPLPFAWPAAHCSRSCSIQVVELMHC